MGLNGNRGEEEQCDVSRLDQQLTQLLQHIQMAEAFYRINRPGKTHRGIKTLDHIGLKINQQAVILYQSIS